MLTTWGRGTFWDATDELAVALRARASDVQPVAPRGVRLVLSYLQAAVLVAVSYFVNQNSAADVRAHVAHGAAGAQATRGAAAIQLGRDAVAATAAATTAGASPQKRNGGADMDTLVLASAVQVLMAPASTVDDPLIFSGDAIRESTPPSLLARWPGDAAAAHRAWATTLTVKFLEGSDLSWLTTADNVTTPLSQARTLVDDAHAWLADTLGDNAELLSATLHAAAGCLASWQRAHEAVCTAARIRSVQHRGVLRFEMARNSVRALNESLHLSGLSLLTAPASFSSRRWMNAIVLASTLLAMLLVQLWLFWSKAKICCALTRTSLGCAPDPLVPCRGHSGNCALLSSLDFPFAAAALRPPTGNAPVIADSRPVSPPVCNAFPDGSARDTFIAALISAAVAVPFASVVSVLFGLSLATDVAQVRGRMRLLKWPVAFRLAFVSNAKWRFDRLTLRRRAALAFLGQSWSTGWAQDAVVSVDAAARNFAARLRRGRAADGAENAARIDCDVLAAAKAFDGWTTSCKHVALVLTHVVWGFFVWLCITYAALIYQMLDPATERQLVHSWAVSLGLNQASDTWSGALALAQAMLLANVLEALWLVPNSHWFEERFDFLSVQAAAAGVLWARGGPAAAGAPAAAPEVGWRRRGAAARARLAAAAAHVLAHLRAHTRHNAALV